ncbi:zinc carboxypeptidase [Tenacibaculum adriaticum]|uniref:Zinc carboxypeptidase n=1 Tax=Tenacibaculum adriaticum TaxID=413713 RepID=A0A5S5DSZ9_9FLAO|nr:M14 family zinc carboxypeptidase [Tenacibaculum adriaticum]TYP99050.1 zinc carboxypeptidase [Tenacibaculum adriaticum]
MSILNLQFLEEIYPEIKEKSLFGKWITFSDIEPLFKSLSKVISYEILGTSEENRPIYKLKLGTGDKKILIWSQMHGNESTGTKAVFDFLNFIKEHKDDEIVQSILKECTIQIIPMLNPDGALAYTRVNAHNIDLNRDAVDKKAKESKLLRSVLDAFGPQFCFNLHDQRTIFGVEGTKNPATISFLAPSEEETRKITDGRKQTMNVIVAMNELLQKIIPNHVGRYTDEFYPTATGDNFQKLGHNTILIEAGHYPDDYNREEVRKFNFYALLQGVYHITITSDFKKHQSYFNIPNNNKDFFDVIHRFSKSNDIAFQYEDKIIENQFTSTLIKEKEGDLHGYYGHNEIVFES